MRSLPAAVALTGVLTVIAGCTSSGHTATHATGTSSNGATLHSLGDTATGGYVPTERNGTPYLFDMRSLCSQGGSVKITSVTAADPTGGMKVVAWGVRHRVGVGDETDNAAGLPALPSDYPGFGHKPVDVACTSKTATEDFDVSVTFSSTRATMRGVMVHYGHGESAPAQFGLALCTTKACAPPQ